MAIIFNETVDSFIDNTIELNDDLTKIRYYMDRKQARNAWRAMLELQKHVEYVDTYTAHTYMHKLYAILNNKNNADVLHTIRKHHLPKKED